MTRATNAPSESSLSRQQHNEHHVDEGTQRLDAVALKATARVFTAWGLTAVVSARLSGVSDRTWTDMRSGIWTGKLSQDQTMRTSALVGLYKGLHLYFDSDLADAWVLLAHRGPLFQGRSPVEFMQAGGLPAIIDVRDYVDAFCEGP